MVNRRKVQKVNVPTQKSIFNHVCSAKPQTLHHTRTLRRILPMTLQFRYSALMYSTGALHYAKISGNFGRNMNGTRFGPGGNFPEKVVHLQRWSSLTGRSGPTETCRSSFKNYRLQSHFLRSNRNFGRNVNGTLR